MSSLLKCFSHPGKDIIMLNLEKNVNNQHRTLCTLCCEKMQSGQLQLCKIQNIPLKTQQFAATKLDELSKQQYDEIKKLQKMRIQIATLRDKQHNMFEQTIQNIDDMLQSFKKVLVEEQNFYQEALQDITRSKLEDLGDILSGNKSRDSRKSKPGLKIIEFGNKFAINVKSQIDEFRQTVRKIKTILNERTLEQVEENINRKEIEYDLISLTDSSSIIAFKKYVQPVTTYQCNHTKMCYNLEDVRKELQQYNFFQCKSPGCNARITSESQLIKDIRWYAEEEFHVQDIMVIEGQLFNKYCRGKRHTDFFQQKQIREQIISLITRFRPREDSINSLFMSNLQSTSRPMQSYQSTNKTGRNIRITFWAICLLDKVQLTIPVRIIGCQHIECYDITSFLAYQKEHANDEEKIFYCLQPGCKQKLDITTMNQMLSQLVIDVDLLTAIKLSPPSTLKFQFNEQTMKLEYDLFRDGGVIVDKVILECYKKLKGNATVTANSKEYQEFERSVQQFVIAILQQGKPPEIEKKLNLQKYRVMDIDMRDSLTRLPIEYPVRCEHSDDFTKCNDLRSIIASFVYAKKANQMTPYICKICQKDKKIPLVRVQINSQLYMDQNLLSYMFKDMSFIHTNVFKYDGKSYMRQEFYDRQKIEKQEYINELKQSTPTPTNLVVEFKQLFCSKNPQQRLTMPLRLKLCPENKIVDFETFYSELEKADFELQKGIILCKCRNCNFYPITKIQGNLYYHEAMGIALTEFNKLGKKVESFKYNFEQWRLDEQSMAIPTQQIINISEQGKQAIFGMNSLALLTKEQQVDI